MKAPYPRDNPVSRLERLQRALDHATTAKERAEIQRKIDLLRNGR